MAESQELGPRQRQQNRRFLRSALHRAMSAPAEILRSSHVDQSDPASILASKKSYSYRDDYAARIVGRAWIASGHDDGTFLSDMSNAQYDRKAYPDPEDDSILVPERTQLGVEFFFPRHWVGGQVDYQITIEAKRVDPYDPNNPNNF